jgi:hypothetical protein
MVFFLGMRRLWPLLLILAMVAPLAGGWALPIQDECQDESECEEGGVCDFDCGLCVCCAHRTPGVTTSFLTAPPEDLPASPAIAARQAPLAPPPIDILHVPKSV